MDFLLTTLELNTIHAHVIQIHMPWMPSFFLKKSRRLKFRLWPSSDRAFSLRTDSMDVEYLLPPERKSKFQTNIIDYTWHLWCTDLNDVCMDSVWFLCLTQALRVRRHYKMDSSCNTWKYSSSVVITPRFKEFYCTNTLSHQCPYTEHAHFNQIEYAMNLLVWSIRFPRSKSLTLGKFR